MTPVVKKIIAGIAVVSALASVVAGREQPSMPVVEPVKRLDTRLQAGADIDLSKLEAREAGRNEADAKTDAFAPRSFSPPAAAEAPGRPAKAEAPPLPFRYVGKMQDGDKLAVFLTQGEESHIAHAGDRIGEYRVDKITDGEIRFTYLPLKTKQSLPL
jgi:hypothetical protein